ncbi:hypothetical protein NDU88_000748 [Pleurodeles waltl]|uniref:Uncharacterized protein n=1 Tax=Pleurodeles waltl TaxID=8319 RepID=A0AAV7U828_PLEWA|nr:hypothetical protein NDU88_000748 [Pleurodeles waltl]
MSVTRRLHHGEGGRGRSERPGGGPASQCRPSRNPPSPLTALLSNSLGPGGPGATNRIAPPSVASSYAKSEDPSAPRPPASGKPLGAVRLLSSLPGSADLKRRLGRRRTGFLVGPETEPTY